MTDPVQNYTKGDTSASGIYFINQEKKDAETKAKNKLDQKISEFFQGGKTKEVTVGDDKIIVGKKDGKKVYLNAKTGEEVVVTNKKITNGFVTRKSFDDELVNLYGLNSSQLAEKHIVAEYKRGKIVLTDIRSGTKLSDEVLNQLQSIHQQDVARANQPENQSDDVKIISSYAEFFERMQANTYNQNGNAPVQKQQDVAQANTQNNDNLVKNIIPNDSDIKAWTDALIKENTKVLADAPSEKSKDADTKALDTPKTQQKETVIKKSFKKVPNGLEGDKGHAPEPVKVGPPVLMLAEVKKMKNCAEFNNAGDILLEKEIKQQGNKPSRKITTVYHKIAVGDSAIYVKQGTSAEDIEKYKYNERLRQAKHAKAYKTSFNNGKTFAKLLHGRELADLSDAQLANAVKDLKPEFFGGFLRGVRSERLIGKDIINSAYYSKSASPQAKKDFAIKVLSSAQGWAKRDKASFRYKNKTYTCESLLKEIRVRGLTEDLAFAAMNILSQIKLR